MPPSAPTDFFEYCPGFVFIADDQGNLIKQSKALTERFGVRQPAEASLAALAVTDDREIVDTFLRALANSDGPQECVLRISDAIGQHTKVRCQARRAPDGSLHGVLELAPPDPSESLEVQIERMLLRAVMDTLEIVLWAVDREGTFVSHDGKALATAGLTPHQFIGQNVFELYPPELCDVIREALAGKPAHSVSEAHGIHWESWNLPLQDARGAKYCVGLTMNVTAALETENELKHQLRTIKDQQRAIHELSAPLIEVWDDVLTVPLVGTIDAQRADELIERLLARASRTGARFAILDLTGAEALDTATAGHLLRLLDSLRLLGVEGMLTGISPIVAQTMVGLEINLSRFTTRRTLRDGLRYCMNA
jgi:rsbT co-antagonist protein RsbR